MSTFPRLAALLVCFSIGTTVHAQNVVEIASAANDPLPGTSLQGTSLPDAPSMAAPAAFQQYQTPGSVVMPKDPAGPNPPVAHLRDRVIPAGYAYHRLDASDKVYIGFRNTYTFGDISDWFLSSAWSQVRNSEPHYGTDRGAYGQRLGAAAINETAEDILTDSVMAVAFHEDPRYFVEGPQHNVVHRTFHALSRTVITRTDSGSHSMNFALLTSYAGVRAIDLSFYPQQDRNAKAYMSGYAYSILGAGLGFLVDEFKDDALRMIHLKKK